MRVICLSQVENSLKRVIDQTVASGDFTVITRPKSQDVVLMPLDTFNSLMETIHLLKTPASETPPTSENP